MCIHIYRMVLRIEPKKIEPTQISADKMTYYQNMTLGLQKEGSHVHSSAVPVATFLFTHYVLRGFRSFFVQMCSDFLWALVETLQNKAFPQNSASTNFQLTIFFWKNTRFIGILPLRERESTHHTEARHKSAETSPKN